MDSNAAFKAHIEELMTELAEGMADSVEVAETLENMMGVDLEPYQLERLAEVLANGSWKSALSLAEL